MFSISHNPENRLTKEYIFLFVPKNVALVQISVSRSPLRLLLLWYRYLSPGPLFVFSSFGTDICPRVPSLSSPPLVQISVSGSALRPLLLFWRPHPAQIRQVLPGDPCPACSPAVLNTRTPLLSGDTPGTPVIIIIILLLLLLLLILLVSSSLLLLVSFLL